MKLKEQIAEDMKKAMKARDKLRTSVLRMILSEIKYAQAANDMRTELSEEESLKVAMNYHKRLSKSVSDFPDGEKKEAIIKEIEIVDEYLPAKASEEEIANAIDELLLATEERRFGALMKQTMAKFAPAIDGKIVSRILKSKLDE